MTLIVIEGPDGSGKTTIANAIAQSLRAPLFEFPNRASPTGEVIDRFLKGKEPMTPVTFQSLQVTNRMEVMDKIAEADIAVCSRYWQSGYVYGSLDGLDPEWLINIHRTMVAGDVNILLDVDPETIHARLKLRQGDVVEHYEASPFHRKVVHGYRELWGSIDDESRDFAGTWPVVDARQEVTSVLAECMRAVWDHLKVELDY